MDVKLTQHKRRFVRKNNFPTVYLCLNDIDLETDGPVIAVQSAAIHLRDWPL